METNQNTTRIHPLTAGAAASVMLVSLLGAAAIAGILPTSHGSTTPSVAAMPPAFASPAVAVQTAQAEPVTTYKVHHRHVTHVHSTVAQAEPARSYAATPAYQQAAVQQPAAQNSPVGIGVGAVLGGLLGNQIGGGNGKTLATIAGAVGGGYVGNEIAKRY
jgi:uncharacterized protein YcfJ